MSGTQVVSAAAVREAVDALGDSLRDTRCMDCNTRRFHLIEARADLRTYLHRQAHDRHGNDYSGVVAQMRGNLAETLRLAESHLAEPHAAASPRDVPRPTRARRPDDRVTCPACGGKAKPNGTNAIRSHRTPGGDKCSRRLLAVDVTPPPIVLPLEPRPPSRASQPKAERGPARLDAGSECRECGKWLPGERSLCGRCYVRTSR